MILHARCASTSCPRRPSSRIMITIATLRAWSCTRNRLCRVPLTSWYSEAWMSRTKIIESSTRLVFTCQSIKSKVKKFRISFKITCPSATTAIWWCPWFASLCPLQVRTPSINYSPQRSRRIPSVASSSRSPSWNLTSTTVHSSSSRWQSTTRHCH